MNDKKGADMRTGWVVIVILAVLTGAEFTISSMTGGNIIPLVVIAFIKMGLILQYFMHLPRVINSTDGGGH
jgi:heme/copper-type cytochrome/quinol oxidase subunit 4